MRLILSVVLGLCYFQSAFSQTPAVLLRGPYLQIGTSNSIIIRWRTDVPTDTRIDYGIAVGNLSSSVSSSSLVVDHELTITSLNPNTRYYYAIGSSTQILQGDTNNTFVTAPLVGAEKKTRIWVTGDCGTSSADQINVRDQYESYSGNNNTDVWLLLGDNAYNEGLDNEYQTHFYDIYNNMLKKAVVWPTPGNHEYANLTARQNDRDIPYYDIFTMPTMAEAGGVSSSTEAYYSYNYGNIHFISLDSYGKEANSYRLYDTLSPQVVWLKQDLAANAQRWTIVYFHHPPYTMGSHNSDTELELINMRQNFIRILERYKVDLVLSGHSHSYERSKLMKGHYGNEASFSAATHHLSNSSALYDGSSNSCPYIKNASNLYEGTVYVVSGSAGQVSSPQYSFPHSAMHYSDKIYTGSLVLTVEGNRLDAQWLCSDGVVRDKFSIVKDVNRTINLSLNSGQDTVLTASWIGKYYWRPSGDTTRSITVSPISNTSYTVLDDENCLSDIFNINVNADLVGIKVDTIIQPSCILATGSVILSGLPSTGSWTLTRIPGFITTTGTGTISTISGLNAGIYKFILSSTLGISEDSISIEIAPQPYILQKPLGIFVNSITTNRAIINWTKVAGAKSYTIQYRLFGASTWISETTTASHFPLLNLDPNTNYEVQLNANNDCGSSTFSDVRIFTTAQNLEYCTASGSSAQHLWIAGVTINGLSKISGANTSSNFTTTTFVAFSGTTATVVLSPGTSLSVPHSLIWKIWIDYNRDLDFDDVNEMVLSEPSTNLSVLTKSISIASGYSGVTRMRIAVSYFGTVASGGANPSACGTFPVGEVEDFLVNLGGTAPTIPIAPIIGTITQPTCWVQKGTVVLNGLPAGNWTLHPGAITGAGATYTKTDLLPGTYNYIVTDLAGTSVTSADIVINPQPPTPSVTNQTVSILSGETFTLNPSGVPLGTMYTWPSPAYTGGVTGGDEQIIPQTSIKDTLTIPSGTGTALYQVTPILGTCVGATFTVIATVTSTCVPASIVTQPINKSMCANGSESFTVSATGTSPFTYQWQYNNSGTWENTVDGNPVGALYTHPTTASLNVSGISQATNYQYRCYIANCSGGNNATSNVAILTVNAQPTAPTIGTIIHPVSTTATGKVILNDLPAVDTWTINPHGKIGNGVSYELSDLNPGTYNCTVTNAEGCVSLLSSDIIINSVVSTSINQHEAFGNTIHVFPNPSTGVINVNFLLNNKENVLIRLIDIEGKVVYSDSIKQHNGVYQSSIDLSKQAKGFYLLQIVTGTEMLNKKISLH